MITLLSLVNPYSTCKCLFSALVCSVITTTFQIYNLQMTGRIKVCSESLTDCIKRHVEKGDEFDTM